MTIRRPNDVSTADEPLLVHSDDDVDHLPEPTNPTRVALTYLPALILFLSELAELLLVSPRIRLLEASICRQHYTAHDPAALNPDGSVDEELCKIARVQERMAHIRGWQVFWEAIPVLALAIPWGILADRIGRKKVLAVNFLGCLLHIVGFLWVCHPTSTIAPERVWFSALAFILGGGPRTGGILILALVNDTSPGHKRSQRFYYTYSAFLLTELIAPPLSSLLMSFTLIYPFATALASLSLALPLLTLIRIPPAPPTAESPLLPSTTAPRAPTKTLPILLLLTLHLLCPLRQELVFQIMIPYASLTFTVPISTAGLLLSLVAASNLLAITTILPRLPGGDLVAVKVSCVLLALGCGLLATARTFVGFAGAAVVFAGGFGVRLAVLAMLTGVVGRGVVGRVYTLVTVVEGVGEMGSALVLQGVWARGLEGGGGGAVWWVGAAGYAGAFGIACVLGKVGQRGGG